MSIHPTSLCQVEIAVSDLTRACAFYQAVFGWDAVPAELYQYVVLRVPKDCPFGISLVAAGEGAPAKSRSTLYFRIKTAEEAESICRKALDSGGSVMAKEREVPGYGKAWQIADPDGQRWGLFVGR